MSVMAKSRDTRNGFEILWEILEVLNKAIKFADKIEDKVESKKETKSIPNDFILCEKLNFRGNETSLRRKLTDSTNKKSRDCGMKPLLNKILL